MIKALLRTLLQRADSLVLPAFGAARRLASAYYLLLNPRFGREHRAVLAGRAEYWRSLRVASRSNPLLRRNVHRLEKGLVMRPRNPVFAEDYVGETVDALLAAEASGGLDPVERRWAIDVLDQYFAAVRDTPPIAAARGRYARLASPTSAAPSPWSAAAVPGCGGDAAADARASSHATSSDDAPWAPRPREQGARATVSYDDFLLLCRQRRSVRWFLDRRVPRELIEQAVAAAAQAPSACNRQPFHFRCFDRPEDARRVAGISMGTNGYAQHLQALVVVVGDLSAFPEERDRHLVYIDGALAAMQFMLALETLGLASCPINWPDVEPLERRMAAELNLPVHLRPVMLIALGYPDPAGGVPHSAKKPVDALLKYDDSYGT
jgi:nitroreductase